MNFQSKVLNFISKNSLFSSGDKLLIALSGGVDSTTLLYFLHQAGYNIGAAHVNYKLRSEADNDLLFCKNICENLNIPFYYMEIDTKKHIKNSKKSVQEFAREVRYNFFREIKKKYNYDFIIVAHHKNDLLETAFFSLIKSKHYNILQTMLPKNRDIRRPFLCVYKSEIIEYAKQNNIQFVEDISNLSDKYDRNKIRLNIFPEILKLNPDFYEFFYERIQFYNKQLEILNVELENKYKNYFHFNKDSIIIEIPDCVTESWEMYIIFMLNKHLGFSTLEAERILSLLEKKVGKQQKIRKFVAYKERNYIILQKVVKTENIEKNLLLGSTIIYGDYMFSYEVLEKIPADYKIEHKNKIYFDFEKIEGELFLRRWQSGDKYVPLGLKGSKLVSDILTDKKVPHHLRKNYWLICDNKGIIYLQNYRIAERVKITEKTKKAGKITWKLAD